MPTDGDDIYYGDPNQQGDYYVDLGLGHDIAYVSSGRAHMSSGAHSDEFRDYGFERDVLYADLSSAEAGLNSYDYTGDWFMYQSREWRTVFYEGADYRTAALAVFADTFGELHVIGSRFDDDLIGGPSNDFYSAGAGNDTFRPMFGGHDVLNGGYGYDWLILDPNYPLTGGVRIDLRSHAAQAPPAINWQAYYGPTGEDGYTTRAGTAVLISIENVEGTAYADDFIGTDVSNTLLGMGGHDRLVGNGGNDILDGGTGFDVMRGCLGDDIYYVDSIRDRVLENGGEGTDTVFSSAAYGLPDRVENLTLTGAAIRGNGNSLANRIIGNDADNVIDGGAGADSMRGGAGNDRYYVDDAGDQVVEHAGEGIDRVYSTVSYSAAAHVELVVLQGPVAIDATGNMLDNRLIGNSADNVLNGRAGADDLRGGGGADTFYFDEGHFGGLTRSTCDRIIDFSHSEGDRVDLGDVDANRRVAGDQAFDFIGTAAFHGVAGELRYEQLDGSTYVYGDTNGDGSADFMIRVDGLHSLVLGDFVI